MIDETTIRELLTVGEVKVSRDRVGVDDVIPV